MSNTSQRKTVLLVIVAVVVVLVGYSVLNAPDRRSPGQKVSDAVNELPNGVDKAARQLESRTPAEKLSDAARDAKDDMKRATNQQ